MGLMGLMGGRRTNVDTFRLEVFLQFRDGYLAEVEHAGGKGCIGLTDGKGITEMLLLTSSSAGDNGYIQVVGQSCQCFVGIALLHTVVIHTGKQNFSRTTFLGFMGPFKESAFHTLPAAFHIAVPAVGIEAGVDGTDTTDG